jgi:uncharacterized protein YcaQ
MKGECRMTNDLLTLSPALARRLVILRQRLAGPRPQANAAGIMDIVRDLGCLQLDPTNVVARSHLLVLWSRLGRYDPAHLDTLLWKERRLFEDWAQAASIVLTEDYPIFQALKRDFGKGDSVGARRVRDWMAQNKALRRHILMELGRNGPLPSRYFEDKASADWQSTGWTAGRNVDRMLSFLWAQGKIMVAGRAGAQKLWDLTERCLPEWTLRESLADVELVRRAAQKSLRALGVARAAHIQRHYIRGCYPGLEGVLAELLSEGRITRVQIGDGKREPVWPGPWYIHADDLALLEQLASDDWEPRTTLLSPFDNLICDRKRTEQLFDFSFRLEIYTPKAKRQYGFYVLPILHGDRLIGRVDPAMDRARGRLTVNAIYAEPGAPATRKTGQAVANAIQELGAFLGATEIAYKRRVPAIWKHTFC